MYYRWNSNEHNFTYLSPISTKRIIIYLAIGTRIRMSSIIFSCNCWHAFATCMLAMFKATVLPYHQSPYWARTAIRSPFYTIFSTDQGSIPNFCHIPSITKISTGDCSSILRYRINLFITIEWIDKIINLLIPWFRLYRIVIWSISYLL